MKLIAAHVLAGALILVSACRSSPAPSGSRNGRGTTNPNLKGKPGGPDAGARGAVSEGAVSGTAFWLGPVPAHQADRPLHFGDAHPRDWQGAEDADYFALADVIVTATRVGGNSLATAAGDESSTFPRDSWLQCYERIPCTPVTLVRGDTVSVENATAGPLSWRLARDGRDWQTIEIAAPQEETQVDVGKLPAGIYSIVDRTSNTRVGWLYRTQRNAAAAGPTNGNCRYSLGLEPGRYRIVAWHPYLQPYEQVVEVRAGLITRVNPVFSLDRLRE